MTDVFMDLGPFRLESSIGKGGMGTVWLARHRVQDVRVAVKVLSKEVLHDPTLIAAFRNEVRAVAALHHPNVVMVLDHGELPPGLEKPSLGQLTAGSPYLVMEYADHGSLSPLRGRLPWPRVKQVLLALLDALAHAHARGVVHRDLKPANVLLTGRNLRVKLTDFGLVHLTQYARGALRPGEGDEPLEAGTPPYMAPEQLQAEWRDSGPWTDLFALGNLAWSLVCGHAPLVGMPLPVVYYRIISRRWPDFEPMIDVPEGFHDWIMRLLEPDPADRYQRAADAAWALMALPDDATPQGNDEPTMVLSDAEIPWDPPTLDALATLSIRKEDLAAALAGLPTRSAIPPLPETWRRQGVEPASMRLLGAGLGLFGLRTVPFVGREAERNAIWNALAAVRAGDGPRVVLVRGPAGVGKSRLCGWITHRAHEVGSVTVLSARHDLDGGADHGLAPMLLRWHQAVDLDREATGARLAEILKRHGVEDPLEADALLDYVAPLPRDDRSTAAFPSLAARHAVLARHLERLAKERSGAVRPIVLHLDDVHWGTEVLSFLEWLLQRPEDQRLPVLVLATVQDDELQGQRFEERLVERIAASEHTTTIELGLLEDTAARELVQQLVGLDVELADMVAERVGGNPLFAVQLIGDWVQRGVLVVGPRGFVIREGESIPDDLQEVWARRVEQVLEGLGHEAIISLELAAVLGLAVSNREWRAAAAAARCEAPDQLVDRLAERKLARVDDQGWAFVHGMFRNAILERARDAGRLRALHAACVTALREVWTEGAPGLDRRLAHHAAEAGRPEAAILGWLAAAREALDRGDANTAEELCERVSQGLGELCAPEDDKRRLRNDALRAHALREQGRHEEATRLATTVGEIAARLPSYHVMADALTCRGLSARMRGDLSESRHLLREAVDLYVGLRNPLGLADCLLALGVVCRQLGDLDDALALLGRAHDLFERAGSDFGRGRALVESGCVELVRGQAEKARAQLREARQLFKQLGAREGLGLVSNFIGQAALRSGDLQTAESQLSKARERLGQIDSPRVVLADANLARLALEQGETEAARAGFEATLQACESLDWPVEILACHADLLACAALRGDWSGFDRHLEAAHALLDRLGARDQELAISAERAGDAALSAGRTERGRAALELAREQWEGIGRRLRALSVKRRLPR